MRSAWKTLPLALVASAILAGCTLPSPPIASMTGEEAASAAPSASDPAWDSAPTDSRSPGSQAPDVSASEPPPTDSAALSEDEALAEAERVYALYGATYMSILSTGEVPDDAFSDSWTEDGAADAIADAQAVIEAGVTAEGDLEITKMEVVSLTDDALVVNVCIDNADVAITVDGVAQPTEPAPPSEAKFQLEPEVRIETDETVAPDAVDC